MKKLLQILFQILSAVGMLFCFGQFEAFGSAHPFIEEDDAKKQQIVTNFSNQQPQSTDIDILLKEVLQLVLSLASSGTHPVDLQLICKSWRNVMRENTPIQLDLKFVGLNPFMKTCMNVWWAEQFKHGVLRYTDLTDATKVINWKFCDVPNGTFDISKCGTISNSLRMTLSIDEFLRVKGENENKIVILFANRLTIERLITTSAQPFVEILKGWDPSFPIGIFWKRGNDKEFYVDHRTNAGVKQISSSNIYENWKKGERACVMPITRYNVGMRMPHEDTGRFHMYFCEPKLEL